MTVYLKTKPGNVRKKSAFLHGFTFGSIPKSPRKVMMLNQLCKISCCLIALKEQSCKFSLAGSSTLHQPSAAIRVHINSGFFTSLVLSHVFLSTFTSINQPHPQPSHFHQCNETQVLIAAQQNHKAMGTDLVKSQQAFLTDPGRVQSGTNTM